MKKLTLDTKIMVICQSACGSAGITANVLGIAEGLMALHFRPKTLLLLGFVIGSKFIPQPAFCKTACYV